MPARNHQVLFVKQGIAEVRECEMPAAGPGQLLIRARVSLLSPGTERAWLLGLANTAPQYPMGSGYSHIGEVVAVGQGVEGWKEGDRVASRSRHAMYAAAQASTCTRIPERLTDERAAFFRLSSIAMQAVRKARIELGEPVAVIGCGLVGLLAIQLARLNGALPVIAIDKDARRLQFARELGVDAALAAGDSLKAELSERCHGEGAAVVIEATGHPEAVPLAFDLARFGGRVALLGSARGETEAVNFYRDVHKKGLTVLGAHESARPQLDSAPGWWTHQADQSTALKLLAADRLIVDPLTTHRFAWHNAAAAYDTLIRWEPGMLGAVLNWRAG